MRAPGWGGNGGRLTWWQDQSGNHNDAMQGNLGSQPVVVAGQLNGQPVVRFDATAGPQALQLPAGFMGSATAAEVFVVLKAAANNPGASRVLWTIGTNGYGSPYPYFDGTVIDSFASTTDHSVSNPSAPLDQFNLYNVASQAGAWVAQLNGNIILSDTVNTVAFASVPLLGGGGTTWSGDIAELIIYDHVLTADERAAVNGYLIRKYALPILPYSLATSDPNGDADGDGLTNAQEVNGYHTDPTKKDTDGDGMSDDYEIAMGLNPLLNDASGDLDGDGVPNNEDARPNNPAIGRLKINIISPANGAVVP